MAYRNKIYVAFDGDKDMNYYRTLQMWSSGNDFNFNDAHTLNTANDDSLEESIKNDLRVRLKNSKLFILLIGESTRYLYKFVRWEIEQAIKLDIPIIAVNLNNSKYPDTLEPPILKNELAIFIPFKKDMINEAINNWQEYHIKYRKEGKIANYHY